MKFRIPKEQTPIQQQVVSREALSIAPPDYHLPFVDKAVQRKTNKTSVRPAIQMKGNININDNAGLEQEADVMGMKAVSQRKSILQLKHESQCTCAACSGVQQLKSKLPSLSIADQSQTIQQKVVQLAKCTCNRSGNNHSSDCPRNKNRLKAEEKTRTEVHEDSKSIKNLYSYDSEWANKRAITEKMVKDFVKTYGVIHGHASSRADKDAKRHANTSKDITAFHSWYEQNKDNY